MEPAILPGQWLLVNLGAYSRTGPRRGDLVIAESPEPNSPSRRVLKRVVGLPDESLTIEDGSLYLNGEHHPEPYLAGRPADLGRGNQSWTLGREEYFLMGDNRAHSIDSRRLGPFTRSGIVGKVWLRIWPPGGLGSIP